jgi:Rod binding domain-containing protein
MTSLETPTFQEALATASTETAKVDEAAKQFEALVVGQVLKVSRESSDGGWLGSGEDQGGEMAVELGEQAFAQAIAARGGFGIAKLVKANLERGQPTVASSGSTTLRQPPTSTESTR